MELRWTHLLPHLRLTRRKEARPAHSRHVLGQEDLNRLGYKIKPQRSTKKPILTIQIRWISECIPCHVVSKAIAVYKLQSDQWNQQNFWKSNFLLQTPRNGLENAHKMPFPCGEEGPTISCGSLEDVTVTVAVRKPAGFFFPGWPRPHLGIGGMEISWFPKASVSRFQNQLGIMASASSGVRVEVPIATNQDLSDMICKMCTFRPVFWIKRGTNYYILGEEILVQILQGW